MHLVIVTTYEATYSLRGARMSTPTLEILSDTIAVKALVEDVAVAIEEADIINLLQTLVEWISSVPSLEL
jgi:hypothetical protein